MRHIDVERKRPQRWPWGLGLVVAAAVAWGVTRLLAPPPDPVPVDVGITAADTLPPAAVPTAPGPDLAGLPTIHSLGPLTEALGQPARARGRVVAVDSGGFWIRSDSFLIRVVAARRPRKGEEVEVRGAVRPVTDSAGPPQTDGRPAPVQIVEDDAVLLP